MGKNLMELEVVAVKTDIPRLLKTKLDHIKNMKEIEINKADTDDENNDDEENGDWIDTDNKTTESAIKNNFKEIKL